MDQSENRRLLLRRIGSSEWTGDCRQSADQVNRPVHAPNGRPCLGEKVIVREPEVIALLVKSSVM